MQLYSAYANTKLDNPYISVTVACIREASVLITNKKKNVILQSIKDHSNKK